MALRTGPSNPDDSTPADHDCTGCALADRRTFLAQAAALIAGALISVGMTAERAAAMPIGILVGTRSPSDKEVTYPIPASDGAAIDKDNDVILARYQGKVYAFGLACPHQNTALRWLAPEGRFQCPKHKSNYTPDGIFLSGRATRSMDRYGVRKNANAIVANIDALYRQDKDAAQWQSAFVEVGQ